MPRIKELSDQPPKKRLRTISEATLLNDDDCCLLDAVYSACMSARKHCDLLAKCKTEESQAEECQAEECQTPYLGGSFYPGLHPDLLKVSYNSNDKRLQSMVNISTLKQNTGRNISAQTGEGSQSFWRSYHGYIDKSEFSYPRMVTDALGFKRNKNCWEKKETKEINYTAIETFEGYRCLIMVAITKMVEILATKENELKQMFYFLKKKDKCNNQLKELQCKFSLPNEASFPAAYEGSEVDLCKLEYELYKRWLIKKTSSREKKLSHENPLPNLSSNTSPPLFSSNSSLSSPSSEQLKLPPITSSDAYTRCVGIIKKYLENLSPPLLRPPFTNEVYKNIAAHIKTLLGRTGGNGIPKVWYQATNYASHEEKQAEMKAKAIVEDIEQNLLLIPSRCRVIFLKAINEELKKLSPPSNLVSSSSSSSVSSPASSSPSFAPSFAGNIRESFPQKSTSPPVTFSRKRKNRPNEG